MDIENKQSLSISILGKKSDKAAAEVIKILAGGAARGVVDYGGDILGGLLGDRIREWRKRNFISSASKTAEFLRKKGVSLDEAKCLKDGEVYRLFDGASRTDEKLVSDLWSGLLANAMDPNSEVTFDIHYTKVLEQLHSHDVKILEFMRFHSERVRQMRSEFPKNFTPYQYSLKDGKSEYDRNKIIWDKSKAQATDDIDKKYFTLKIDPDLIKNSIENLVRLGLIFLEDEGVDVSTSFLSERSWNGEHRIDNDRLLTVIEGIVSHIETTTNHKLRELEGSLFTHQSSKDHINLMYDFTGFGERLINACYVE